MGKTVQKSYTTEFKREAVRLALESGKSKANIARELGNVPKFQLLIKCSPS